MIDVEDRNSVTLTLPIESVDLILVRVVERTPRKVFVVAFDLKFCKGGNLTGLHIEKEMVMRSILIEKQADESNVVIGETTSNERLWKVTNWHRMIIQI
jgi:hypothetical protein